MAQNMEEAGRFTLYRQRVSLLLLACGSPTDEGSSSSSSYMIWRVLAILHSLNTLKRFGSATFDIACR